MKAIDNKELILSLEELEKEKGITRKRKSRHRQTNRSNTHICNKRYNGSCQR